MLRLRLLHSIFKASFLRHTLKTLTKLLIKLNRIYASYFVPRFFRNYFHCLSKRSVTFATAQIVKIENLKQRCNYQRYNSCIEFIHSHQSLYGGGVHVKQSFLMCNTFQAVYEDSVIM